MKARSAKNKGQRLAKLLKNCLLSTFKEELDPDDIMVQPSGVPGEDLPLSPKAQALLDDSYECKNQEKLNIWDALKQCESNCKDRNPVVVFKRNRSDVYVAIQLDYYLELKSIQARDKKA